MGSGAQGLGSAIGGVSGEDALGEGAGAGAGESALGAEFGWVAAHVEWCVREGRIEGGALLAEG